MAIILNGTSQYLSQTAVFGAGTDLSGYPFTVSAWIKPANLTASHPVCSIERSDASFFIAMFARGSAAGDPAAIWGYNSGGSNGWAETSSGYSAGVWQHVCMVCESDSKRTIYLNGGSSGEDTTDIDYPITAAQDGFEVGIWSADGGPNGYFEGRIAQLATWDVALSGASIARLANGAAPTVVEDSNLQNYWDFVSDATDSIGGDDLTPTGSPTYDDTDEPGPVDTAPSEKISTKHIVCFGGHNVYKGSTLAGLAVVSDASGDMDTTKRLDAFDAEQKVFIANREYLRVLDCANTKLTTADIGANPPDRGNTLTGGTSGATMVVDYIDALMGATTVYGYRTSTATFVNTETVTGTDDDSNAISFTLNADEDAPDHWYTWTEYGGSTTNMPDRATIAAHWRGRAVLAGNSYNPTQFWMSRVNNPWDFDADTPTSSDALRPIYGALGDTGRPGDVIKAIIPFNDTYLIWACGSTIYLTVGDPAAGGQTGDIKGVGGIIDSRAWTWDDKGNLWMLTEFGLMRVPKGFGSFENMTEDTYPDLIDDIDFDASTDRIVMQYDSVHHGIVIAVSDVSSVANTANYFYDPRTGGLFKDAWPDVQTIYSSCYYGSDTPADRLTVFGCSDGYLRTFDADTKNDDGTAINSYVDYGPIPLGDGQDREGIIHAIKAELGGGSSGGSETDSDDLSYKIWVGSSADGVVEKLYANTTPNIAGTFSSPGRRRGGANKRKAKGLYGGVKVYNTTSGEAWSLEKMLVDVRLAGRRK